MLALISFLFIGLSWSKKLILLSSLVSTIRLATVFSGISFLKNHLWLHPAHCNKGVFNKPLMNLAIKDFKTYEDSSLQYLGLTTHKFERYGLMDTVVSKKDLNPFFENKTQ